MFFLNSKTGLRNWFVLGPMQAVRANVSYEFIPEPPYSQEVPGWAPCLTEVAAEAPYEEDIKGIPFDNANIRWVRTRCWRQPFADGGGDMEWWTAVSRVLPDGYTPAPRYSGLMAGFYADYLGDDPMSGTTWNRRTPTGVLLNDDTDPDGWLAKWTPMNLNDQVLSVSLNNYLFDFIPFDIGSSFWEDYTVGGLVSEHVGFRGAKIDVAIPCPGFGPTYPLTVTEEFFIACVNADEPAWSSGALPAEFDTVESFTVSTVFASSISPTYTTTVTLGAMVPPLNGMVQRFIVYQAPLGSPSASRWEVSLTFHLGPRTDIPLWYDASMGNRVAPGGYIAP